MRRPRRAFLLGAVAVLSTGWWSAPAQADDDTIVVHPGPNAIQEAVDEADPGDTIRIRPGVYEESVLVTKPLTIKGAGWGRTVIMPPATPSNDCGGIAGFCVFGAADAEGNVVEYLDDVRISRLAITGFDGFGILATGTEDLKVTRIRATDNGEYGVGAFDTRESTFAHTYTSGNHEAGLYMGDSPDADSSMHHNVAVDNGYGIFVRDSTDIAVEDNRVMHNCIGIFALDTAAPTAAGDFDIEDNRVIENDRACPPAGPAPAFSGLGILLLGTHDVEVDENRVLRNVPSGDTILSGGIVLVSGAFAGGAEPTGNDIEDNRVLDNVEFDLFWDGSGSDNDFDDNRCETSEPAGLCDD